MVYQLLADEELTRLLNADDEDALKEIYLRYWKPLYFTVLKKVRSKEIAEELVQNLFLSLWNNRKTAAIRQLEHYLNRAIKYQVINFLKSKILHEKFLHYAASHAATEENSSEAILLMHELSSAINKAIRQLPEKTGQVFRLSRLEHHSVKEISQLMNISEKAVEYHITISLKTMRLHLKDFILAELIFLFLTSAIN